MWRFPLPSIFAVILLGIVCSPVHAEMQYTVKDLGTLGGTYSDAIGINNAGDIAGVSGPQGTVGTTTRLDAFLYHNGVMTDLGAPFEGSSAAGPINSSGQIVINSSDNLQQRAYLYSNGQYTDLGNLGKPGTFARGINDAGQVVGNGTTASDVSHAFLYSGGMIQDLGTFGGTAALPQAINNSGTIVGRYGVLNSNTNMIESHGFIRGADGAIVDLGDGLTPGGINDAGTVVGGAFIYRNGAITQLDGAAADVNNHEDVVGTNPNPGLAAFIYSGGQLKFLNSLIAPGSGLYLASANAINDMGQIVGSATTASGDTHAFLLTPVPEPAALTMIFLGSTALLRRRRDA